MMIPIAKPMVSEHEKKLVLEVLESGELAQGRKVKEFEEKFAAWCGGNYGVATSSGTTALQVALQACGIRPGDRVLTTPFSFIATANSILYCGAEPVFCDVDEDTFNISPSSLLATIAREKGIKALLIVHLFGLPCDMDAIMNIVREHGLILIEDCAQAHGTAYKGKRAGTFGRAGIFSFYPTKNMTTSEGGIVITDDEQVHQQSQLLRNHGMPREYEHTILGYNFRMTNISAALGLGQLERLEGFIDKRRANARFLDEHLKGLPGIRTPQVPSADYFHVYNQYTLRALTDRKGLMESLRTHEIGHKIFYPTLIPDQPLYTSQKIGQGDYPVARLLASQVLSIPVHPALNEGDLKRIVETLGEYCKLKA
jgi:perosamine synthetase